MNNVAHLRISGSIAANIAASIGANILPLALLLTCFSGVAGAKAMDCIVPNTVVVDILPAGCDATITNGPLTFTGLTSSQGDNVNLEIDTLELFNLNSNGTGASVFLQGVQTDTTTNTVTNDVGLFQMSAYQISPNSNTSSSVYSPDTGTQNFTIYHFIVGLGGGNLKLNFGESGKPSEVSTASGSANSTSNPGDFTITSFFDIFTEIRLDPSDPYVAADDDFVGNTNTPGAGMMLGLQNFDPSSNPALEELLSPEPASSALIASGLGVFCLMRRRKKA